MPILRRRTMNRRNWDSVRNRQRLLTGVDWKFMDDNAPLSETELRELWEDLRDDLAYVPRHLCYAACVFDDGESQESYSDRRWTFKGEDMEVLHSATTHRKFYERR